MNASTSPKPVPASRLRIGGVTPFSATDYPGRLAAVVFVQGCPWRCSYCHNPHLQARQAAPNAVPWERLQRFLERRRGLLDAVVFSGGEPTLDPALGAAIDAVRALGFAVGLHTACIYPQALCAVLPRLDWVGFDVKAPFADYAALTGSDGGAQARACVAAILASGVAHECRTTTHPEFHSAATLLAMADTLAAMGVRHFALQHYRPTGQPGAPRSPVPPAFPGAATLAALAARFDSFCLRSGS